MRTLVTAVFFVTGLYSAHAQSTPAPTPAETSTQSSYAPGEVVTPEGRVVKAYFPSSVNGFEKTIGFYDSHPEVRPFPPVKHISVDKISSMTVRGHYFEMLKEEGKSLHVLAYRLVDGPVQLFNFAEDKSVPVPIPIAGPLIPLVGIPYTKNHWYLKRNGEVTSIDRARFVYQVSTYFQDFPELAQKIKDKDTDYQYQNLMRLVLEYNQHLKDAGAGTN